MFRAAAPWLVVNAAAYTAVDAAEDDAEAAYRANRDGPAALARLCAAAGVPLIHISTDYVFDGAKGAPYVETDAIAPPGVYGATQAGRRAGGAGASGARTIVLRTSWVYAPTGKNFVRTMLRVGAERDRLRVVADQRGCPTTARGPGRRDPGDRGAAAPRAGGTLCRRVPRRRQRRDHLARPGGRHVRGGRAVRRRVPVVEAITTAEYPTPAKRPADSRLDCGKLAAVFGVRLPDWRASLARTIEAVFAAR